MKSTTAQSRFSPRTTLRKTLAGSTRTRHYSKILSAVLLVSAMLSLAAASACAQESSANAKTPSENVVALKEGAKTSKAMMKSVIINVFGMT